MESLEQARIEANHIVQGLDLDRDYNIPPRENAERLFLSWNENESSKLHAYSVAYACEGYAKYFGIDSELAFQTGLLHDYDNERSPYRGFQSPNEHPLFGIGQLQANGHPAIPAGHKNLHLMGV